MMQSNYDKQPYVAVPNGAGACVTGWQAVTDRLSKAVAARSMKRIVLTIECYTGRACGRDCGALEALKPARESVVGGLSRAGGDRRARSPLLTVAMIRCLAS